MNRLRNSCLLSLIVGLTVLTVLPAGASSMAPPNIIKPYPIPLAENAKNRTVVALQYLLSQADVYSGDDPVETFGPATKSAVMKFQTQEKITADGPGVVGNQTWQVLMTHDSNADQQAGQGSISAPATASFVTKTSTTPGKQGILFFIRVIPGTCVQGRVFIQNISAINTDTANSSSEHSVLLKAAPGPNVFQLRYLCNNLRTYSASTFITLTY